jgi:hypothetical protein
VASSARKGRGHLVAIWKHCPWCVYSCAREALKVVLVNRLYSVGVDRMPRNFEPMRKQVEAWQRNELTDVTAKVVIYEAFVEGKLEAPKHLARSIHDLYFEPSTRSFGLGPSGVSPTRSHHPLRNWTLFRSSGQQPSQVSSLNIGSRSRSKLHMAVPAGPPILYYSDLPGRRCGRPTFP